MPAGSCGNACVATIMLASTDADAVVSFRLRIPFPPLKLSGSVPFVVVRASPSEGPGFAGSATLCSAVGVTPAGDEVASRVDPVDVNPVDVAAAAACIEVLPPSMARMMASAKVSGVVTVWIEAEPDPEIDEESGEESDEESEDEIDAETDEAVPAVESAAPVPSPCSAPCVLPFGDVSA